MKATRLENGQPAITDGKTTIPVASMSVARRIELQTTPEQKKPTLDERIEHLHELERRALADLEKVTTREQLQAWKRRWIG